MSNSSRRIASQLGALRFSLDIPSNEGRLPLSSHLRTIAMGLTLNELPVSDAIAPGIESAVGRATSNLGLRREGVDVFVYASPEIQATCLPSSTDRCVLRLSSELVSLLSQNELSFVVGHELAHHVYGHSSAHFKNEEISLEEVISLKYQEISADRLGLLACQSLKDAAGALIKAASGLTSPFIRLDVSEYLSTLSRFDDMDLVENDSSITSHPPLMIRCRALLWFFGAIGSSLNLANLLPSELDQVNGRIERDFSKFVDIHASTHKEKLVESYRLWLAMSGVASHGSFTKDAQEKFCNAFGIERLDQVKGFLSSSTPEEAIEYCRGRLSEAVHCLRRDFPASSASLMKEAHHEINMLGLVD